MKKFISIFAVLTLMLCFAVSANADTVVEVSTFAELQAAIEGKAPSIKLTADMDADELLWFDYSVALDGDGHTLSRAEGFEDVILLFSGEEALVEDLTVDGKDLKCTFADHIAEPAGIPYEYWYSAVVGCKDTTLTMNNCVVKDNNAEGVYSTNILIMNNCTVSGTFYGVDVYPEPESEHGVQLTMKDCVLSGNSSDGILFGDDEKGLNRSMLLVEGCTITGSSEGIDLYCTENVTIKDCLISESDDYGVYLYEADGASISGCTITGSEDYGIYVSSSDNVIIEGSTVETTDYSGIYFNDSDNTEISGCTVRESGSYGIYYYYSENAAVADCEASGNYVGIALSESDAHISGETLIKDNSHVGFELYAGKAVIDEGCIITGNYSEWDYGAGIYCAGDSGLEFNGLCYNNHSEIGGDDIYVSETEEGVVSIRTKQAPMVYDPESPFMSRPVAGYPIDDNHSIAEDQPVMVPFIGWFEDFEGTRFTSVDESVIVSEENGNLGMLSGEEAALKAVWGGVFLVYDANDGSGNYQYAPLAFETGADAEIADNMFERAGWDFVEWNTKADGSGDSYKAGDALAMDDNTVLYAIWKKVYTMTYLPGGDGVTNLPEADVVDDKAAYVVDSTVPQRDGYVFVDWTLDYGIVGRTSYLVEFREFGTGIKLQDSEKAIADVGQSFTFDAPELDGYTYHGVTISGKDMAEDESVSAEMQADAAQNVVTFWYDPLHTVTYKIAENRCNVGRNVLEILKNNVPAPETGIKHGSGLVLADKPTYEPPEPTEYPKESYKVNYLELGTDKQLAPQKVVTDQTVGSILTERAIDIDGYVLYGDSEQSIEIKQSKAVVYIFSGWYSNEECTDLITELTDITEDITVYGRWSYEIVDIANNEITFYYDVIPAPPKVSYTVRYIDVETDERLIPDVKRENVDEGSLVREDAPYIPGYIPYDQSISFEVVGGEVVFFVYYSYAEEN